jgi:hypothetical protein
MRRLRSVIHCLLAVALVVAFSAVNASAVTKVGPNIALRSPASAAIPQISGQKQVGGTLTTTVGSWSFTPASYAIRWLRCDSSGQNCQPMSGFTTQTITVPAAAANVRLRVKVTATATAGTANAMSHSTMLIAPATTTTHPATTPPQSPSRPASGPVLFQDQFNYPDGLITNEYSHWSSTNPQATLSPIWQMTSGSFFSQNGTGWTGVPDGCSSSSTYSTPCTASDVFRLNTAERDFGNVTVSMDLLNNYLTSSSRTPAVAWDGVHIWLHYQSEYNLYYASFNRRDGQIVIKKKCAGGTENGGTYYELGQGAVSGYPIPFGAWQPVAAQIQDNPGGSVTITMYRSGTKLLSATDTGVGCAPITAPGSVGVRGDNDNFNFDNVRVTG